MRIFSKWPRPSALHIVLAALAWGAAAFAQPAGPPPKPEPDILIFKNGDQLTGTLERGTGNTIVFKSDMAGEITVSLDNIRELRAHAAFAVLQKGIPIKPGIIHDIVHPGQIRYADGTLNLNAPGGVSSSIPESTIAFLIDQPTFEKQLRRHSLLSGWQGNANAGATDVQATSYGTTFTAELHLVRAMPLVPYLPPHDRTTFDLAETYGKLAQPPFPQTRPPTRDSVAKTSIFHADVEHDRYFSPRFYALADLSIDHSFAQGLDLQQIYGGGFGWTPIQNPRHQLDLKADVHYEKQEFNSTVSTQNQNIIGSTFSEGYRRNLPGKLVLTESGSVAPAWNNLYAYGANGAVGLALPAFHRLTVNVDASDSFLNNPPIGFQKNSFQFSTGLGYIFTH